ncbi:MAG: hypothetical protein AB1758_18140, partial [Candidatus Eremiobacterota bacterium]
MCQVLVALGARLDGALEEETTRRVVDSFLARVADFEDAWGFPPDLPLEARLHPSLEDFRPGFAQIDHAYAALTPALESLGAYLESGNEECLAAARAGLEAFFQISC